MRIAVVQFPGSNCDRDAHHVLGKALGVPTELTWHRSFKAKDYDAAVLPGGFSYGDYLRAGAIAAHTPALKEVERMGAEGKPVLGICNGFQMLIEAGLLPGALLRNSTLKFCCKWVDLLVEGSRSVFTRTLPAGAVIKMPIAHGEGRYVNTEEGLEELRRDSRVCLRYCGPQGDVDERSNPNGSLENIAGICNEEGNVMGLMPHPERASEGIISPDGREDGLSIFNSMISALSELKR